MPVTYAIPRNYTPRQRNYINYTHNVINYDSDNAYPQRVLEILMGSSTGVACSNLLAKFISGNGFSDSEIGDLKINYQGQTANKLLSILAKDYSRYNYFAIHVNYNLNFEITSLTRIDPRYARLGLPDSNEYVSKIAIYNDWTRDNYKIIKRKEIDYIDTFNPNPEAVRKQIELAGGIGKYKGQVWLCTNESDGYPRCPHDSVLNDLEVDAKISTHSLTELDKGFMAKHILFLPFTFENDEERQNFKAGLQAVEGAEGNSLFIVEHTLGKEEQEPELKPIDHTFTDLKFEGTQEMTRQKIYRAYNQPGILHTDFKDSGLSSADQIKTAFEFYNQHTKDERTFLQNVFYILLSRFYVVPENLDEIDILEREFITGKGVISQKLGSESTTALLGVLSGPMAEAQKVEVLINIFGIKRETAELLVSTGDNSEENANIPNIAE